MMKLETQKAVCQYCSKSFRKESTLAAHLCEPKRRWQQEKEAGVQLGLQSYLKFFEMTQGSAKTKSYKDFVESPYYSAFVKFGQYLIAIRAINATGFIEYVIKGNKKLDQWTKECFYDEYLYELLRKEHPTVALERSFTEMQKWADAENKQFNNIFREGATNKICNMIVNGRISPWIIFNCDSGIEFLSSLNEEQVAMVFKFIEPDFWQRKLKDYVADAEFIKSVLQEAKV
jgi:hypothetical protein